jgi:hypothetical protein
MFYQFNGETIEHIRIVRDTIKENTNGTTTWEYSTDVGVVFELEHGAVGIIKNGHGGQALLVERANTTQTLDLIDNSDQWQDDLTTRYESSRQFFPLKELLLPESDVT